MLNNKRWPQSLHERFVSKIKVTARCWIWIGNKYTNGYGQFDIANKKYLAHRMSYEIHRGFIPEGLVLDHACRVRHCVNPWHLEPVTMRTNLLRGLSVSAVNARKTHCKNGHALTSENTNTIKGHRACRACHRLNGQRFRAKHRALGKPYTSPFRRKTETTT